MDTKQLEDACFAILNDHAKAEEEKIEAVEELVRSSVAKDEGEATIERIVLDILWAHRQGVKKPKVRIASQKDSNAIKVPEKPSKKKWVSLDNLEESETSKVEKEASPYQLLQSIFGENNREEDIDRLLAHNEFDIGRTVEMLLQSNDEGPEDPELLLTQQTAQRVVCKYFLAGNCMRGNDCMYSHNLASKICRFWLQGRCLAGDNCIFLHEVPQEVVEKLRPKTQVQKQTAPLSKLNTKALPSLGSLPTLKSGGPKLGAPAAAKPKPTLNPNAGAFDLSAINSTLAEAQLKDIKKIVNRGVVPVKYPIRVPWDQPEYGPNASYIEVRALAKRHGEARNKYLQMATDSWATNDPASAKLLSKKGQTFNTKMIEAYRSAADAIYDYSSTPGSEIFIDLHGLELGAAIDHLENKLLEIEETQGHSPRVAYVISGRGHYKLKRHADQLSQHVKAFLDRYGYSHRDFGENQQYGRLIGIDPWSSITN